MTIQDWGAIGELIGGVAVIATLVYLSMQIRQNTKSTRPSCNQTDLNYVNPQLNIMLNYAHMNDSNVP